MSWRDDLRPASFRGVQFYVTSAEKELGRRSVTNEFPGRDEPDGDDLGRRARRYNMEAYVIGEHYMLARDALQVALEKPGPGELVHPFYGTIQVRLAGSARIRETTKEGGWAQFSLAFVEAGKEEGGPTFRPDYRVRIFQAAGMEPLDTGLVQVSPVAGSISAAVATAIVSDAAFKGLTPGQIAAAFRSGERAVRALTGKVTALLGVLDDLSGFLDEAFEGFDVLLLTPAAAYGRVLGVFASVMSARRMLAFFSGPEAVRRVLATRRLLLEEIAEGNEEAPASQRQVREVQIGTDFAVRVGINAAACVAIADLPIESSTQAAAISEELTGALRELEAEADDEMYGALVGLRIAVANHLATVAGELPRVSSFTPGATLPALVLAHQLYADANRTEEIVRRNRLTHPLFVPAGKPLEVLVDA